MDASGRHAAQGAEGPEAAREAAVVELQVTEAALMENPKSYGAWHHRGWVVSMGLTPVQAEIQQVNRCTESCPPNSQHVRCCSRACASDSLLGASSSFSKPFTFFMQDGLQGFKMVFGSISVLEQDLRLHYLGTIA